MKKPQHDLYTPALLAKVKKAYAMDYEMFERIGYGKEPTDGAKWAGADFRERQTMGGFDRSFWDEAIMGGPPPKGKRR